MASPAFKTPVTDSVAKINHELAVGEDLAFQRKWWRFERALWVLFVMIIALDCMGAFGRGPLAKSQIESADRAIEADYERIERTGTPSMMTVKVNEAAKVDQIELFVSDSAVSGLGLQRVIPAPETTKIGSGGFTYRFPRGSLPAVVRFEFQPVGAGFYHIAVGKPGEALMHMTVAVVP